MSNTKVHHHPPHPHAAPQRHHKAQSQKTQQDLLEELHPVFRHKVQLILT